MFEVFRLNLIGPLRIFDPYDKEIILGRKSQALLGFLAWEIETPSAKTRLQNMFWSNVPHARRRDNLKKTLQRLQKSLGGNDSALLILQSHHVTLDRCKLWIDAHDQPNAKSIPRELLEGCDIHQASFDIWLHDARDSWKNTEL
jgi:DNA-binding SARP family transcriptional activator